MRDRVRNDAMPGARATLATCTHLSSGPACLPRVISPDAIPGLEYLRFFSRGSDTVIPALDCSCSTPGTPRAPWQEFEWMSGVEAGNFQTHARTRKGRFRAGNFKQNGETAERWKVETRIRGDESWKGWIWIRMESSGSVDKLWDFSTVNFVEQIYIKVKCNLDIGCITIWFHSGELEWNLLGRSINCDFRPLKFVE